MDGMQKIKLGISSCLLGQPVRYDGGDKYDANIHDTLGKDFELVPVCPEMAIGLGVPRPPIQLVQVGKVIRVLGVEEPGVDVTEALHAYGKAIADELASLCGYIFKARSPSCGLGDAEIHDESGAVSGRVSGAFAYSMLNKLPLLPAENEERLLDAKRRENFLVRIHIYHRWQQMLEQGLTVSILGQFHARHEALLAHYSKAAWQRMGRMLVGIDEDSVKVVSCLYMEELMNALKRPARTPHPLQHI